MPSEKVPTPTKNNLVERRDFLSGAATLAGASLVGGAGASLLEPAVSAAIPPSLRPP